MLNRPTVTPSARLQASELRALRLLSVSRLNQDLARTFLEFVPPLFRRRILVHASGHCLVENLDIRFFSVSDHSNAAEASLPEALHCLVDDATANGFNPIRRN